MSIYLQHFALAREPFSIVPDPGFLYPSVYHRQAVAHLKYGLDREGGFILLTGEVGTGKTTLTRTMIKRIPPHVRVAYILNSKLNASDVLASICDELDIKLPNNNELSFTKQCIDALNQDLLAAHAEGKKTLIVLEEAQNLTSEVLETLRLLSNLETSTHKLLHILLVGQPELLDILAQTELRQLNQRVVSRFHLSPLDKHDLSNYINHRLHRAGAKRPIFDEACISVLFRLTGGVPRLINLVCHQSLVAAYSLGAQTVSAKLVKQAAKEILSEQKPSSGKKPWLFGLVAAGILIAALGLFKLTGPTAPAPQSTDTAEPVMESPVAEATDVITEPFQKQPLREELLKEELLALEQPEESPVTEAIIATPTPLSRNPFVGLLALWGADAAEVYSEEELAAVASANNLRTEKVSLPDLAALEQINRPGIVWLQEALVDQPEAEFKNNIKSYVLTRLGVDGITLQDRQGEIRLSQQDFETRWTGRMLYLWRPPQGYNEPLMTGAGATTNGSRNPEVVDWLQAQLAAVDSSNEIIISGGRYTAAIAQQVLRFQQQQGLLADGILGRETLMRLAQLSEKDIPLLRETD